MLDPTGLNAAEKALFEEAFTKLGEHYDIRVEDNIGIPLEKLELFKNYSHFVYKQAMRIKAGTEKAFISIIQVEYSYSGPKGGAHTAREFQVWAFAFLPKNFGHLIIKPETYKDKLLELFQPLEMNFAEDRDFCRKFYVLAKDQQKAQQLLNQRFRDEVKSILIKGFHIELLNDFLIFGNNKSLGNEDVIALADFVHTISEIPY